MAGLDQFDNPDIELDVLYGVNGLGESLPGWGRRAVSLVGEHGIPVALALLVVAAWFLVRRRADAHQAVAGTAWAGLAAGLAFLANAPIRDFVARPRPFVDHPDVAVLVSGKDGYSFVSDHASVAMAIAVALFLVHRVLGAVAFAFALLQGFARVLLGVHYPSDVIGGYALGTAVALLLAPLALAALTPLVRRCGTRRSLGWIARPPGAPRPAARATDLTEQQSRLAA
ncbi:phosphatase PAP2 family protein [Streptomyces radicis]|uniref:Phosphatase PAP2 family protein n=1 Tax=Streptomyces radicis TaxID=1750517 RepID=A0A3A9WAN2_9ACTN|nr:phosphatase PAP2 family protein [Streptomyces radicis]RKN09779.1 phosphatase PAP2 family protein [Streptomyces radicis]RKN23416.1 phosphatase PAP2 family protein [Streptomyces radicis]